MEPATHILLQRLGIDALSPMQIAMGKAGDKPNDIILLSPTGTGKTIAYLLPLVRRVQPADDRLQAIVILPSRELAQQSAATLQEMKTGLRALCLHGGRPTMEEHRKLTDIKPQVVFATPGRLNDHMDKGNLDCGAVATLVIDEFDKSLKAGFEDEMKRIVFRMPRTTTKWLLSATDSSEILMLVNPSGTERLDYLHDEDFCGRLQTVAVRSAQKDKLETAARLLSTLEGKSAIVFVAYRESAERVGSYLKKCGFAVEVYHGGMDQEQRERSLYKFRSGGSNVLVSTDLAARGLDIPDTEVTIHYHLPADEAAFTHRCGRATRWDSHGVAYLVVGPEEHIPEYLPQDMETEDVADAGIAPTVPHWATIYIGRGKKEKISRADVAGFLCKKGGLKGPEIGKIDIGPHHAYAAILRKKLRPTLQALAGEKIKGMKTIFEEMK